jgi:hypothetical protein
VSADDLMHDYEVDTTCVMFGYGSLAADMQGGCWVEGTKAQRIMMLRISAVKLMDEARRLSEDQQ